MTRDEADVLIAWNEKLSASLVGLETERVYYSAQAGDTTEAISQFGRLLRSCHAHAAKQERTLIGWCKSRLTDDASKQMQWRVMSYLPMLLEAQADTDAVAQNQASLRDVITNYGWRKVR